DAFGHGAHAQRLGELDGSLHHQPVTGVTCNVGHEAAVDLQHVDGKTGEQLQRRVAGTEVVDGNRDARIAQTREQTGRLLDVRHQRALGYLQLETLGTAVRRREQREHVIDEPFALELYRRNIDSNSKARRRS